MLTAGWVHPGARAFVDEYLGGAGQQVPFVGRQAELALLAAWWGEGPPVAVISAPAGMGKSALLLRFAWQLDEAGEAVVWAPISLRFGTHRSATVEGLLAARLRRLGRGAEHWRDALEQGADPPLLVVLDGLDELHDEALLQQLRGLTPGPGVKVLVAARSGPGAWAQRLGWTEALEVTLDALSLHEVTALLEAQGLGGKALDVMGRTGGDPLLVRLCVEALAQGQPLPDARQDGLVAAWWQGQRQELGEASGERLLWALASAQATAPWAVLATVLEQGEAEARRAAKALKRFVVESDEGVAMAHPRFAAIVRERWPEQVRRCDLRFAELALRERLGPAPHPYWLHFALPHLQAVGAPAEAIHGLISPSALEAWRRSEGSSAGFLREIEAARALSERTLAQGWGDRELRRLALYRAVQDELRQAQRQRSPALRVALVKHGMMALRPALSEALGHREAHEQTQALLPLLPLLPDALLPELADLDLAPSVQTLLAERLLACGATQAATQLLREAAGCAAEALLRCAPMLPAASIATLREAEIAAHLDGVLDEGWTRIELLPLLDPEQRLDELRTIEARVSGLPLEEFFYDGAYERDLRAMLAEAFAAAGQPADALRWLGRLRGEPAPWQKADTGWWPDEVVRAHARVALLLEGETRDEALGLLGGLPRRRRVGVGGWVELVAALPGRLDEAWGALAQDDPGTLSQILRSGRALPALRERAAARALALAQAALPGLAASDDTMRSRHAPGALASLTPGPLSGALLDMLPAWIDATDAGATSQLQTLAALAALHGQGPHAPKAAEALRRLAGLRCEVWAAEGWERLLPLDERRALLAQQLAAPLRLSPGRWIEWVVPSMRQLEAASPRAASRARAALRAMAGRDPFRIAKALAALTPGQQEEAVCTLLASLSPPRTPPRLDEPVMLAEAAASVEAPELRRTLALAAWRWAGDNTHFARPAGWNERVAPFFPEEQESREQALRQGLVRVTDPLAQIESFWWLSNGIPWATELRRGWLVALLQALEGGGERAARAQRVAAYAVSDADAATLLCIGELLPSQDARALEYAGRRAQELLEDDAWPEPSRTLPSRVDPGHGEPLIALVERAIATASEGHMTYHYRFRLELVRRWRDGLRGRELLRAVLSLVGEPDPVWWGHWMEALVLRAGLAAAAAEHVCSLRSPHLRLGAWDACWRALGPSERQALVPRLLEAYAGGGTLWEPFVDELPIEALRQRWFDELRRAPPWASPLLLHRVGGASAAAASVEGTLEGLSWFASPD